MGNGWVPKYWGISLFIDQFKSDIPQHSGTLFLHTSGKCMGKATTQYVRDTALGGVDQKVISPNIWVPIRFSYIFLEWMYGKSYYPTCPGYHFGRGRPESDIPQYVRDVTFPHTFFLDVWRNRYHSRIFGDVTSDRSFRK
jgi:hypothetical protein